jgi:hypothetical protein
LPFGQEERGLLHDPRLVRPRGVQLTEEGLGRLELGLDLLLTHEEPDEVFVIAQGLDLDVRCHLMPHLHGPKNGIAESGCSIEVYHRVVTS